MSSEADDRSTYNWITLRYLVDPLREITVPMGAILWSEEEQRLWFRLPQEDERLPHRQRLRRPACRTGARLPWRSCAGAASPSSSVETYYGSRSCRNSEAGSTPVTRR